MVTPRANFLALAATLGAGAVLLWLGACSERESEDAERESAASSATAASEHRAKT